MNTTYAQSAHGLKGLRTFPTQAANVIGSVPVCADDDCMQCAMGLYCPNAPKTAAKPRVRVCLDWTASQLHMAMSWAIEQMKPRVEAKYTDAQLAQSFAAREKFLRENTATILDAMRGPTPAPSAPKPRGTSKSTLARIAAFNRRCAAQTVAVQS